MQPTFAGENMAVLTTTQNLFTPVRTCRCFDISSLGSFDIWMSSIMKRLILQINKTLNFFLLPHMGMKVTSKVEKYKNPRELRLIQIKILSSLSGTPNKVFNMLIILIFLDNFLKIR